MADGTVTITWGIPVSVTRLLTNLDGYAAALPEIIALRLCNQFGKGEQACITRLPKELVTIIEDKLMEDKRDRSLCWMGCTKWSTEYCCFEGSCRPNHHVTVPEHVNFREEAEKQICEEYPDQYDYEKIMDRYETREPTPEGFDKLVENKMDDIILAEDDWCVERMMDRESAWLEKTTQGKDKPFDRYDKVLRKHFGLQAFIMHENLGDDITNYLCRNDKRFSSDHHSPEHATICYLTLPTEAVEYKAVLDRLCREGFGDVYYGRSGKSVLVTPESLDMTEAHRKRFARAMKLLSLRPSVHPTQLHGTISGFSPFHRSTKVEADTTPAQSDKADTAQVAAKDAVITARIKELERSQWPKLVMLVKEKLNGW